jgi:hypothetical protein
LDVRQEFLGDIDGFGFTLFFAGEVKGGVARAFGAVATGATTAAVDGDQAGGQDGAARLGLLEASQEEALNERGRFGGFHGGFSGGRRVRMTEKYIYLSEYQSQNGRAKK